MPVSSIRDSKKAYTSEGIALHAPGTIAAIAWFVHFGINMAMLQRRIALLAGTLFNTKTAWIICALLTGCVTPARLPTLDQVQASTPQALDSSDGQLSRKYRRQWNIRAGLESSCQLYKV